MSGGGLSILASIMYFGTLLTIAHDFWRVRRAFVHALFRIWNEATLTPPPPDVLHWRNQQPDPPIPLPLQTPLAA